ncbi:MAG: hypothetical protein M3Y53_01425 [Thermoproteota archaeon]|nr:hypothetical protein [Thermoproteota archaeon]
MGERGLRTAYEILLRSASRGEVLRYFYPYDDYHEIASPFYSRLYQFQKAKGLERRGINSMRFVSFPLPGIIDIIKNNLLIITWANVTGILVTSKEIAEHFKNYSDSIWNMAG